MYQGHVYNKPRSDQGSCQFVPDQCYDCIRVMFIEMTTAWLLVDFQQTLPYCAITTLEFSLFTGSHLTKGESGNHGGVLYIEFHMGTEKPVGFQNG